MLWIVTFEQIFTLIYSLLLSFLFQSYGFTSNHEFAFFFSFYFYLSLCSSEFTVMRSYLLIFLLTLSPSLPLLCFQQSISRYHTIPYISQSYTWWRPAEISPRYQICLPFQLQYCQGFVDCNPRSCHIRCFTYVHNVIICFFADQISLSVVMLLRFAS